MRSNDCLYKKRKRHQACVCTEERLCEGREKTALCMPRREASGATQAARGLDLGLAAYRTVRKDVSAVKPPSLCIVLWQLELTKTVDNFQA